MVTTYSKSIPSSWYVVVMSTTALANAVRFSAEPTAVEKYPQPVQPPMVNRALVFFDANGQTRDKGLMGRDTYSLTRRSHKLLEEVHFTW